MVRLCLNGIVKNEAARIERMLDSVGHFISYVVLVDTGSEDNTKEVIRNWCEAQHIPCEIKDAPFHDWAQARNAALAWGRQIWCETQAFDYLLLCDADMELKVADRSVFDDLTGPSYDMYQHAGTTHYQNRRLLKADQSGQYLGVTHEFLNVPTAGCLPEDKAFFFDHADGANRPDKFKRDIKLLKQGLKDEPNNERYMFYLGNSYRDAGNPDKAAKWFKKRVEAGGWDEEVWYAQRNYATCLLDMGEKDAYVAETLKAYQMRPSRAETLYDLAHWYRLKGENDLAVLFAEAGRKVPMTNDALFVDDRVYKVGLLEELGIAGFYNERSRPAGAEAVDKLSLMRTPYWDARETARSNMYWYLKPLAEYCPSCKSQRIDWEAPDGWTCMNPSITRLGNKLVLNMRTVNYRMDEQGRYLIKDVFDDGTTGCNATAENPIHTRNWLLELQSDVTYDPLGLKVARAQEIKNPPDLPCEFPLVVGFEDMRLFSRGGELWSSSTVRQIAQDGIPEQVLAQIVAWEFGDAHLANWTRMLRPQRECEKNWAPCIDASHGLRFMYKTGHMVDATGADLVKYDSGLHLDDVRGGSQLLPFKAGYLAIVHEARTLPNSHKRFYWHRFVYYDVKGAPLRFSDPFVLDDRVIEFVAGMCWRDGSHLLISYGSQDAEARLAQVTRSDVEKMLGF